MPMESVIVAMYNLYINTYMPALFAKYGAEAVSRRWVRCILQG